MFSDIPVTPVTCSTQVNKSGFYICVRGMDPLKRDQEYKQTLKSAFGIPSLDVTVGPDSKAPLLTMAIITFYEEEAFQNAIKSLPATIDGKPVVLIQGDNSEQKEKGASGESGSGLSGNAQSTPSGSFFGSSKTGGGGGLFSNANSEAGGGLFGTGSSAAGRSGGFFGGASGFGNGGPFSGNSGQGSGLNFNVSNTGSLFGAQKPAESVKNAVFVRNLEGGVMQVIQEQNLRSLFGFASLTKIEIYPDSLHPGSNMALLTYSNKQGVEQALGIDGFPQFGRPLQVSRYNDDIYAKSQPAAFSTNPSAGGIGGGLFGGSNASGSGGLFGGFNSGPFSSKTTGGAGGFLSGPAEKIPEKVKTVSAKSPAQAMLEGLYTSMRLADVTCEVQGEKILAHKVVLAERSKYFSDIIEKLPQSEAMAKITISDVAPSIFKSFVKYLYCDTIPEDQETAVELLKLSKAYEVAELKTKCEETLASLLSIANFVAIAKIVEEFEAPQLREALLKFSVKNSEAMKQIDLDQIPKKIRSDMI